MSKKYKVVSGGAPEIRVYVKRSDQLWKHAENALKTKDYDACSIMVVDDCKSLVEFVLTAPMVFLF